MIAIVTATGLEARAARKAFPQDVRVIEAGICLSRGRQFRDIAISCGVAGGLRDDLPTGTVLVPRTIRRPDGSLLACDADLVESLLRAASALGYAPIDAPLLTSATLVHGRARATFAAQGYAGVDMESGLIEAPRIACVRVVLDTPQREISPAWQNPASAWRDPRAWLDLPFLARDGPRCAKIAALIAADAVRHVRALLPHRDDEQRSDHVRG